MATKRILTPAAALRIKQLYAEQDEAGRRKYSQMQIAVMMGCGETTVYRVLQNAGAYMALPEPATDADAEASLTAFQERFPELAPGHTRLAEEAKEQGKGNEMLDEIRRSPLDE